MLKDCEHNIPETKKGVGPCDIRAEVKKRNGRDNWWCRTHGMSASAPDGGALSACSGSWFDPVAPEAQLEIDLGDGEYALWGVVGPALQFGEVKSEPGKIHVHYRASAGSPKELDSSYDIVRVTGGSNDAAHRNPAEVLTEIPHLVAVGL